MRTCTLNSPRPTHWYHVDPALEARVAEHRDPSGLPLEHNVNDQPHENPVEATPEHVEGVQRADAEAQAAVGVQGGLAITAGTVESEMQIHQHTHACV